MEHHQLPRREFLAMLAAAFPAAAFDWNAFPRGHARRRAANDYDAIVIGSRAYETDTALVANNDRLLAYVRGGGHVLVQYQQYPYVRGGYAPYPLTIATPHDRVTDETSPVTVLNPGSRVFREPNVITGADWDGWPQERGLYFAHTWDSAYAPLLEMHDPGMPPLRGGLLVAAYGRGTYIYTGLSFFPALPAGVPGAECRTGPASAGATAMRQASACVGSSCRFSGESASARHQRSSMAPPPEAAGRANGGSAMLPRSRPSASAASPTPPPSRHDGAGHG